MRVIKISTIIMTTVACLVATALSLSRLQVDIILPYQLLSHGAVGFSLLAGAALLLLASTRPRCIGEFTLNQAGFASLLLATIVVFYIVASALFGITIRHDISALNVALLFSLLFFLGFLLGAVHVCQGRANKCHRFFALILLLATAPSAFVALGAYHGVFLTFLQPADYPRIVGAYQNPNFLAQLLVPGAIASLFLFLTSATRLSRFGYVFFSALIIYTIFLTHSRGSWIALLSGTVLLVFFGSSATQRRWLIMLLLLPIFSFVLLGITSPDFLRVGTARDLTTGRATILRPFFEHMRGADWTSVIFGHGHGTWTYFFSRSPHGDLQRLFFDYGIIGSLLVYSFFIFFAVYPIIKARTRSANSAFLASLIVAALVHGLTNTSLLNPNYAIYWVATISCGFAATTAAARQKGPLILDKAGSSEGAVHRGRKVSI